MVAMMVPIKGLPWFMYAPDAVMCMQRRLYHAREAPVDLRTDPDVVEWLCHAFEWTSSLQLTHGLKFEVFEEVAWQ